MLQIKDVNPLESQMLNIYQCTTGNYKSLRFKPLWGILVLEILTASTVAALGNLGVEETQEGKDSLTLCAFVFLASFTMNW